MIHLELNSRQAEVLVAALESALSDLSYEISSTDRLDYRNKLKERRVALQGVVKAVAEATQPA